MSLPATYRRLFPRCTSDSDQRPSAAAYLDADTEEPSGMLFSRQALRLYQQEEPASTRSQAKEPAHHAIQLRAVGLPVEYNPVLAWTCAQNQTEWNYSSVCISPPKPNQNRVLTDSQLIKGCEKRNQGKLILVCLVSLHLWSVIGLAPS